MSGDLFWQGDDLEDGSTGRCYDYSGAQTPEEAALPMTYWTKKRIIAYARISSGDRVAAILSGMRLEDLRVFALCCIGEARTGNTNKTGRWRTTEFYSLDMDNLRTLEASA